jgi:macrolide transport system ATP-binding/permease protein
MKTLRSWIARLFGSFKQNKKDREFAEEMESHLAMHIEDNLRLGMSPEESRRNALIRFGGIDKVTEEYRDRRGLPFVENLFGDIRYSFRTLGRDAGFTISMIGSLSLGLAGTIVAFAFINGALLRPFPGVRDQDRLVEVGILNRSLFGWGLRRTVWTDYPTWQSSQSNWLPSSSTVPRSAGACAW